ncbi:MAG: CBS domain-containing protein [Bryobacteraceae bacterium]|jgi:CBS domain-containing protein
MRVDDIMTKGVSFCDPGTNAAAAAEIMWTRNCGSLPVVENGGHVVGIVTDRDLFIALGTSNKRAAEVVIGEIMNRELSLCAPGDDVRAAMKTMGQRKLQRLVAVDKDGRLKGILSIDDLVLQAGAGGLSNEDVIRTMKAVCERRTHTAAA